MNAEKELLLALLIEKYTSRAEIIVPAKKTITRAKHKRHKRGKLHKWTDVEKQHLLQQRRQGRSFGTIAGIMGLRVSQVENMHYALTAREAK